jgi:hypothetical protein
LSSAYRPVKIQSFVSRLSLPALEVVHHLILASFNVTRNWFSAWNQAKIHWFASRLAVLAMKIVNE